jgi:hypothetical protein
MVGSFVSLHLAVVVDTSLYQYMEIQRVLPEPYFFIGVEAFVNTSAWSGHRFDRYKDSFNYY